MELRDLDWPRRTERLVLRPARTDDVAAVWRFRRLPEVGEWLGRHPSAEDFPAYWERLLSSSVVALLDGVVVGTGKVEVEDGWAQDDVAAAAAGTQAELGWVLDPAVGGRGLGTELARELLDIAWDLGVRRVVANAFADNVASTRVMEKVGMRREALFRKESLHRTHGWIDGVVYAALAEERG